MAFTELELETRGGGMSADRTPGAAQHPTNHSMHMDAPALDSPDAQPLEKPPDRCPPGWNGVASLDVLTCHETLEDDLTAEAAIATLLTWSASGGSSP